MTINGELTIRNIDRIVNEFIDEFSIAKKANVKSDLLEPIDVAGIQFLSLLVKLSLDKKNEIKLNINIGNESRALIEKNGFKDIFNHITNK